jgi:hypothetical protein
MRFTHEGSEYLIEFERSTKARPRHTGDGKTAIQTTARILKVTGPKDREVVRTYTVGHYHKDKLNYEAGRKYALLAAMYDAPTKGGGEPLMGKRLTKAFRTAVWLAYHKREGGLLYGI